MKKTYVPPTLEVYTYRPEKGYANSISLEPNPNNLIMDVSDGNENVEEGNNYNLFNEDNWY